MVVSTGLAVANNYYAQPLAVDREATPLTRPLELVQFQCGDRSGLQGPWTEDAKSGALGDLVERRPLIVTLSVATAAALLWLGSPPDEASILSAAFAVGD